MPSTLLTPVSRDQVGLLGRLSQYYAHDMLEYWPDPRIVRISETGEYELWFDVSAFVDAPGREALLISAHGQPAGFILTERMVEGDGRVRWGLAEFFVVRHMRRSGIGRAAAFNLFEQRPGAWQIAVLRRNVGAAKFWRSILRRLGSMSGMREIDARSADWDGPIFMFGMGDVSAKPSAPAQSSPDGSLTLGEMIASELES